jgi:hypothetical protein
MPKTDDGSIVNIASNMGLSVYVAGKHGAPGSGAATGSGSDGSAP